VKIKNQRITKLTRGVRSTSLGLRHIAQKAAQRRVSKALSAIPPASCLITFCFYSLLKYKKTS